MCTLDIILPAYNPLPGWEGTVISSYRALVEAVPEHTLGLIIVNDGSKKMNESLSKSILLAAIPELTWVGYEENRGKGYALREGVKRSTAEYIVYTDIDWPYTHDSMVGLIGILSGEADVVIGKRDEVYYTQLPSARRRISKLLRKFNGFMLRLKVDDTQAGLKGFRKNVKDIFLSTTIDRYLFDLEFIYLLSAKKDISISGYAIKLRQGITFSKMNRKILFREASNFLKIWWKGQKGGKG